MQILNIILQAAAAQPSSLNFFVMMGLMIIVMYFFMIRPQQKKAKAQKLFIDGLKSGDLVITTGGIHGKVVKVEDNIVFMEIEGGNRLKIEKSFISGDLSAPLNK